MMEIYAQLGQRGAAIEQFRRCREILQQELSIDPLPETQALYQQLLDAPAEVSAGHSPPAMPHSAPFDSFGRAPWVGRSRELALIERQLEHLRQNEGGAILVGGVAGVGKTQLAQRATALAQAAGVTALWGICPNLQEPPPYQGLVEILQKGLTRLDTDFAVKEHAWLAELTCLLPELGQHFSALERHPPDDFEDAYSRSRLLPAGQRTDVGHPRIPGPGTSVIRASTNCPGTVGRSTIRFAKRAGRVIRGRCVIVPCPSLVRFCPRPDRRRIQGNGGGNSDAG